ncbi:hypothetical protein QFZ31_004712 [Neobacillus niacini]|nr:hypothetical protein [Neobacillus niacini]
MIPKLKPINPQVENKHNPLYIPVAGKFWISHCFALLWLCISIYIAHPWLEDLADHVSGFTYHWWASVYSGLYERFSSHKPNFRSPAPL